MGRRQHMRHGGLPTIDASANEFLRNEHHDDPDIERPIEPLVRGRPSTVNLPDILSTARPRRQEPIFRIPAFGLTVRVRVDHADPVSCCVIETGNAAGLGPPLHRRAESEIVEILTGRYLFEVDGQRFIARRGDLVIIPGGATRAFVNITGTGARQQVFIQPVIDVASFHAELRDALHGEGDHAARLRRFGVRWGVDYLGPPLAATDAPLLWGVV